MSSVNIIVTVYGYVLPSFQGQLDAGYRFFNIIQQKTGPLHVSVFCEFPCFFYALDIS